jgi:hypothetical protein
MVVHVLVVLLPSSPCVLAEMVQSTRACLCPWSGSSLLACLLSAVRGCACCCSAAALKALCGVHVVPLPACCATREGLGGRGGVCSLGLQLSHKMTHFCGCYLVVCRPPLLALEWSVLRAVLHMLRAFTRLWRRERFAAALAVVDASTDILHWVGGVGAARGAAVAVVPRATGGARARVVGVGCLVRSVGCCGRHSRWREAWLPAAERVSTSLNNMRQAVQLAHVTG